MQVDAFAVDIVGGSSAGASIQGSLLLRGDPGSNSIIISEGHDEGFGFLADVAIDQHVSARNRQGDLVMVIRKYPKLLGIGIDENTAIVVNGSQFEVIGAGKVFMYDAKQWPPKDQKWWTELAAGMHYDLLSRVVMKEGTVTQ